MQRPEAIRLPLEQPSRAEVRLRKILHIGSLRFQAAMPAKLAATPAAPMPGFADRVIRHVNITHFLEEDLVSLLRIAQSARLTVLLL